MTRPRTILERRLENQKKTTPKPIVHWRTGEGDNGGRGPTRFFVAKSAIAKKKRAKNPTKETKRGKPKKATPRVARY